MWSWWPILRFVFTPSMFLTPFQTAELCWFAYLSDAEVRSDLAGGFIRNEDDYTSNFTSSLRRAVNTYAQSGLHATSYLLPVSEERRTGCDATIILTTGGASKVVLFEAKAPGLAAGKARWDYKQSASGLSHFSDQLARQGALHPSLAVFEMFYCDYPFGGQPVYMDDHVSSCVWHTDAMAFDASRSAAQGPWSQGDLTSMLQAGNWRIDEVLAAVCECTAGKPIGMSGEGDEIAREFELEGLVIQIHAEGG